jgi:hypothetical protein
MSPALTKALRAGAILGSLIGLLVPGIVNGKTYDFEGNWGSPGFQLVSQRDDGVEMVYSLNRLRLEELEIDGETMQTLAIPGALLFNDQGMPNLPGMGRYIAVPRGASVRLEIVETRTQLLRDIDIAPAPAIPREGDDSPLIYHKDPTVYGTDDVYPREPIRLSNIVNMRGVDAVIIGITPFQYHPVRRELTVFTDIRLRVHFTGGSGRFTEDRYRSRYWEPVLRANLLNYSSLEPTEFVRRGLVKNAGQEGTDRKDVGCEYVIITPDDPDFIAWADTIKHWRTLQGISTGTFTLTETGSSASQIESFINNAYNTWDIPPVAVLLLSDYPSSGKAYGITSPLWNSYCVSDNIYADVDGDDLPEMNFARICAQDAGDLETMINKFLDYERNPYTDPGFYDHPVCAGGWQTERWFILCSEVIYGFLANVHGKSPVREYAIYSGTPGSVWSTNPNTSMIVDYFGPSGLGYIPATPEHLTDWGATATRMNNDINSGCFIVQHRDHGGEDGWGEPDYTNSSLDGLSNTMLPFVFSINCLTGKYNWGSECFTEKFHRIEHGALGLIGASETSYSFVNDTYVWGMYDGMWPEFMPDYPSAGAKNAGPENLRPGFANITGKYFLQASNWPYNPSEKDETYHLFHLHGDAFTTLYSQVPQSLTVTHPGVLYIGATSFPVTADDGSVIALTVDGQIIGTADGTGSMVSVPIAPQSAPGTMVVTVTKHDHFRYAQSVPVLPPEGAFVVHHRHDIDDDGSGGSGGNDDGIINPGETIELFPFWVMNYGVDTAFAVTGELALQAADPLVTLIDTSDVYGTIAPDDSALGTGGFSFAVDLTAPDGHGISFALQCTDGDSVWQSYFTETVRAPVLTYVDNQIDDSAGGNGDGRIDPGETVDLSLTVKNTGGGAATGITGEMVSLHPDVTVTTAAAGFPDLDPAQQGASLTDFTISVDPLCPTPNQAELELTLTEARGFVFTDTFSVRIGMRQVLFVDDDNGDSFETYFTDALDALDIEYDVWTVYTQGSPPVATMEEYITVIWSTGDDYYETLNSTDEANLMTYLDGGGTLYLSSQDYLYDIGSPTTFSSNYLHVASWTSDTSVDEVAGIAGDPISHGLSYVLDYPFYNWSDNIVPDASAAAIFKITAQKSSEPLRPPKDGLPPDFGDMETPPAKQNYCGLRFPAGGDSSYLVVFTAIPFEAVPTAEDREELLQKILEWLQGDEEGPTVAVLAPNGGEFWPVGSTQDIDWLAVDPSGVDSVSILLSADGGSTFPHIITSGKPNMPPYSWIVTPPYSDSAVVKVVAYDAHKNTGEDVSDSLFATADLIPPEGVDDLAVAIASGAKSSSGDLFLWWSPVADNWGVDHYIVYRGSAPGLVEDSVGTAAETEYVDAGAVGDTLVNYFYLVKAVDLGGNRSVESNCVGEFDEYLTNIPPDSIKYSR